MNIETLREYCLSKPGASESFPFGEETLVFKVGGKAFALLALTRQPFSVNLKCDPEKAIQLREEYEAVQPGYHMNKTHWNTVIVNGSIRGSLIQEWVDDSYDLVKNSLPKALREQLN